MQKLLVFPYTSQSKNLLVRTINEKKVSPPQAMFKLNSDLIYEFFISNSTNRRNNENSNGGGGHRITTCCWKSYKTNKIDIRLSPT